MGPHGKQSNPKNPEYIGYCVGWSILYALVRLLNPNVPAESVLDAFLRKSGTELLGLIQRFHSYYEVTARMTTETTTVKTPDLTEAEIEESEKDHSGKEEANEGDYMKFNKFKKFKKFSKFGPENRYDGRDDDHGLNVAYGWPATVTIPITINLGEALNRTYSPMFSPEAVQNQHDMYSHTNFKKFRKPSGPWKQGGRRKRSYNRKKKKTGKSRRRSVSRRNRN
jgi:hypothetical protein